LIQIKAGEFDLRHQRQPLVPNAAEPELIELMQISARGRAFDECHADLQCRR
jgi:hypothetical protein